MQRIGIKNKLSWGFILSTFWLLTACGQQPVILPTLAAAAVIPEIAAVPAGAEVPPTFTPPPATGTADPFLNFNNNARLGPTFTPSPTSILPSKTPTNTPTARPTNTRPPTATPPPGVTVSNANRPHIIANPNHSKLSIHVIRNNSARIMEFVREAQPTVIKAVDDLGFLTEVKEVSPNTITIGRLDDINQQYAGNPEEEARKYVQNNLSKYYANPGVDFWEGWNEPDPGVENMNWYARFEAERVREMARYGLRTAIGGFASGVPELNEFEMFLPAIETAIRYRGILTLHEYSAPVIDFGYGSKLPGYPAYPDRGSLTFRYRWYYRELLEPRGLVIPLVITEAGIDGIIGNRPGPPGYGWLDFQSYAVQQGWGENGLDAFVNQMAWYDAGTRQDEYVLGFTIFTAGAIGHWKNYDIDSVLPRLTNYVKSQQ